MVCFKYKLTIWRIWSWRRFFWIFSFFLALETFFFSLWRFSVCVIFKCFFSDLWRFWFCVNFKCLFSTSEDSGFGEFPYVSSGAPLLRIFFAEVTFKLSSTFENCSSFGIALVSMSSGSFVLSVSFSSKILKSDFRRCLLVELFWHLQKINLAARDICF